MILDLSLLAPKQAGTNCMQDLRSETNNMRLQLPRNLETTLKRAEFTLDSYQRLHR